MTPNVPAVDAAPPIAEGRGSGTERIAPPPLLRWGVGTVVIVGFAVFLARSVNWSFISTLDFSILIQYRYVFLQGTINTVLVTAISMVLGFVLALLFAGLYKAPFAPLRWFVFAYVEILRDIPLAVALFWIHYALPYITGFNTTVMESGIMAMTLQSSAYLADVIRAGIQALPKGQWNAADAMGLPLWSKWCDVVLPQALSIMLPSLVNIGLGYFKASSVLALLSVGELMTVGARISTFSFKPIETLTTVGLIYLVLGYILSWSLLRFERFIRTPGT